MIQSAPEFNPNPLLGPMEKFTLHQAGSGMTISPLKAQTYFFSIFLIFAAAFIFYMSFSAELQGREIVRWLLVLMSLNALYCCYYVFQKGSARLHFVSGGRFIEYLGADGENRQIDLQLVDLKLIKEIVTSSEDSTGYEMFKLSAGKDILFGSKKLSYMNEIIQKLEIFSFKVYRTF